MDAVLTIFWGLLLLIVLVFVHELGHFLAARLQHVRVTEFMIGLPGPSIGFERKGCRYGITCIPLGGYNRITGMEGGPEDENLSEVLAYVYRQGLTDVEHTALALGISEDDADFALEVLDGWGSINKPGRSNKTGKYAAPRTDALALGEAREVDDPVALLDSERLQTYRGRGFLGRVAILLAGPLANVVLGILLVVLLFCGVGISYATTTVDAVVAGSGAQAAGLQGGDTIIMLDGQDVESFSDFSRILDSCQPGQTIGVGYMRDGDERTTQVTIGINDEGNPAIGIYARSARMRLGLVDGLRSAGSMLLLTVQSYVSLFNPSTAAETLSQSTSIVGISVMARQAAGQSMWMLVYLLAVVSLSLAVVNLLPVPPLDGGKVLVEIIEKIARRPIPVAVINAITVVVIVLLVLLFVFLLRQDIVNYVLGGMSLFG